MAAVLKKFSLQRVSFVSLGGGKHCKFCSSISTGPNIEDEENASNASRDLIRLKPELHKHVKKVIPHDLLSTAKFADIPLGKQRIKHSNMFNQANFDRRMYAKFGSETGVKPNKFWPSAKDIEHEYSKHEFFKPLAERIQDLKARKQQEHDEKMAHQQHISEQMAKMPEFIKKYEAKKNKRSEDNTAALERRQALLEEAREFFGYEIDYRDVKFQRMVEWKEEQSKKAKKAHKKQVKDNLLALDVARITAAADTSGDKPS